LVPNLPDKINVDWVVGCGSTLIKQSAAPKNTTKTTEVTSSSGKFIQTRGKSVCSGTLVPNFSEKINKEKAANLALISDAKLTPFSDGVKETVDTPNPIMLAQKNSILSPYEIWLL
jgi:hypothetical protein